jgi:hypothetical protein
MGKTVELNQCLFGYNDGHRLLASSMRLPHETASLLLVHSDLLPGFSSTRSDRYLTGLPLPAAKVYALMRTWLAPEMPRPGCVWTHVILINLSNMARFENLGILASLFVRPDISHGFSAYNSTLTVGDRELSAPVVALPEPNRALRVLRLLYEPKAADILLGDGADFETTIFSVWSQQWPRLRRAFSFRTVGLVNEPARHRFDLRVVQAVDFRKPPDTEIIEPWEKAAIDDLLGGSSFGLRRFLWRYGSDMRRGRERFRFLSRLFLTTGQQLVLKGKGLTELLDEVVREFPDITEGRLLKDDLLSCGESLYSLLPETDPVDVLNYIMEKDNLKALPQPPPAIFGAIKDLWLQRAGQILEIAERAEKKHSSYAEELLDRLSAIAEPESFLGLAQEFPNVRDRLVRANPGLLNSPDVITLSEHELNELLPFITEDHDLVARVLNRFVYFDSVAAVTFFAGRHLDLTRDSVFAALLKDEDVPKVWTAAIREESHTLVADLLARASSTRALGILVNWIGLNVADGLVVSATQWAEAVRNAQDDVDGPTRQRLLTYLLALALARPEPGCEPLFEIAFDTTHSDIAASRLPNEALNVLARKLPDVGWWDQWDICLRLRLGVAHAYVNQSLDPESFLRLTKNEDIRGRLINIAADTKSGRRYLRRLSLNYRRGWAM